MSSMRGRERIFQEDELRGSRLPVMRVIAIGNGLAGTIFSKTLKEMDKDIEIDIFSDEKYSYYPKPNLIRFLSGDIPFESLSAFPKQWYEDQNIDLHLAEAAVRIHSSEKQVELKNGTKENYDILFLSNGASAFVPPIKGVEKPGVFTLRTIDDALGMIEFLKQGQRVTVIGGGILGLEIARALKSRGAELNVIEFFPYLLGRQLDAQGGAFLKEQIERMGIKVFLDVSTEEIFGEKDIKGVRLKNGREIVADMVVIAAGVRPNIAIAKQAGLETKKGILVNDFLQTSQPEVFAAGDNAEHRGQVYGIIPASFEQAKIAAQSVVGQREKYEGTVPSNTLKVVGLDVTSVGSVNPEKKAHEEIRKENREKGLYKKIVLQDGALVGAIWMGTRKGVNEITRLVTQRKNIDKWKEAIVEEDFDFSVV